MTLNYRKTIILILLIALVTLNFAQANLRWKAMNFDNPGSKRVLKAATGNYFYFRSLPEKSMLINTNNITSIEIRSFSKAVLAKPVFYLQYSGKRTAYSLKLLAVSAQYQVYEPVRVTLPPGVKQLELLCYDRNIYFRAFEPIQIQKKTPVPSLKITSYLAKVILANHSHQSTYYTFNSGKPFTFQVKKGKVCDLYFRAQLTSKTAPQLAIYKDGVLLSKHNLSIKRTNTYKVEGLDNLTIGKKVELPALDKNAVYEIRSLSSNVFVAKPIIKK